MSKITFRADDDLVDRVEELDASKSEVMREALRSYLEGARGDGARLHGADAGVESRETADAGERSVTLDDIVAERIDALIEDRLDRAVGASGRDVNVNITVEADERRSRVETDESAERPAEREASAANGRSRECKQCGEGLSDDHVYCPNCGEKAARRVFCECGTELSTDWAHCPSCGRRTPSADVLDR